MRFVGYFKMKSLFYTFSIVFTFIICFLAGLVTLLNLYLFIRRRFLVKVNCWFCNTWTKVEYDNQNSFECPTCLQYNGFTKDGDYNRIIPEQHDEHLNPKLVQKKSQSDSPSKGLCATCNYNQGLKVFQLANFVPLVEKNYDVEVEHFQKQLEKAYGLCGRCEKVLEKTLEAQNLKIIGNRVRQLQKETVSLLDLSKPYKGTSKKPVFIKCIQYSIIMLAGLILVNTVITIDYSDQNLRKLLPHFLFNTAKKTKFIFNRLLETTEDIQEEMNPVIEVMSEHCTKFSDEIGKLSTNLWGTVSEHHLIKHCLGKVLDKIPSLPQTEENEHQIINYMFTAIGGLLLQMILCFWNPSVTFTSASRVLSWFVLTLLSFNVWHGKYELFRLFLKVFCPLLILYTTPSLKATHKKGRKAKQRKNIRRLAKEDEIFSDLSDDENLIKQEENETSHTSRGLKRCDTSKLVNTNSLANTDTANSNCHLESDLNASLSNLALGSSHTVFSSKPLLSPSKLGNVTKNPWTAGGFWSSPYTYPSPESPPPSRSSSHSSGFESRPNVGSLPASPGNSVTGGDDRLSVFSEPQCHFSNTQFELYKTRSGAVGASFYSPNCGVFGAQNVFQYPNGVVWSNHAKGARGFPYPSSVVNWPFNTGYVRGSLFKNLGGQVKADSKT